MTATIKIKNSSTAGAAPTSSDLVQGELAVNVTDKRLYTENASGTIVELGTNPSVPVTFPDGSASAPSLTNDGDTNTGLFFPAADTVGIATGGSERARVDSSGNLGLGVTPSAWASGTKAFEVGQVGNALYGFSSTNLFATQNAYYNGTNWIFASSNRASYYQQNSGLHTWSTSTASGTAGNAITWTQAMTLDASGNLGVGTTSPNARITVKAAGTGYTTGALALVGSASGTSYISSIAGSLYFSNNGSTDHMVLDSSGNLLVGTTSTTQSHKIVGLTANAWALQLLSSFATGSQNYGIQVAFTAAVPNNSSNYFFQGNDSSVNRFIVYSNGGIANYSANNVNLSDSREKTNVNPAGDYLAKICAIPVRTYNYIDQNLEEDAGLTLGVFAQDVQEVAPELVMESNWGTKEEPKMRLSIYQTDLQYALMKCIQEQQTLIQDQLALINSLTARVEALENK